MIPEITLTCHGEKIFINSVTVGQYKHYVGLMEKNDSERMTDVMFFNKKILQGMFENRISLAELGELEATEFLTAAKGIHFIMQEIVSRKMLEVTGAEEVEQEESAFDEYDMEEDAEEGIDGEDDDGNVWRTCGEIVDRIVKISIRLMKNSYSQCMKEDMVALLEYLKFELDTVDENQ